MRGVGGGLVDRCGVVRLVSSDFVWDPWRVLEVDLRPLGGRVDFE